MAYKQRWNAFFNNFDANKSGDLTSEDAEIGMQKFANWMQLKKGTPEYQKATATWDYFTTSFIKATDRNNDGKVTKAEFDASIDKLVAAGKAEMPQWWIDACRMLFDSIDKNGNGEISGEELIARCKNLNPDLSDDAIKHAHEWAKKTSGHAKITKEAFVDLIWFWGSSPDVHPELDIIFVFFR